MGSVQNVYLSFQGIGFSSGKVHPFDVLCGKDPPTITDGYGKWSTLDRPLQRGLTIFQGYDPAQMTVSMIFGSFTAGGWQQDDTTGIAVEADIGVLEWMGGSNFQIGPPPVVYVFSYLAGGGPAQTDLIPPQYAGIPWVVASGGLTWGQAWRNPNGYRIYQEATVTLINYLNLNAPPVADTSAKGSYFKTRKGRDTALLIAAAALSPTVDQQSLARSILSVAQNNPIKGTTVKMRRRSISWVIPNGISVWVPAHTII